MQECHVVIQFPQHTASITVTEDSIRVFKTSARHCDFDIFDLEDQELASEYIMEPMPTVQYVVHFKNDT